MIRISLLAVLLFTVTRAEAAELCAGVAHGAALRPAPQATFPADVKPFVVKADPTFQDQVIELYPLGKDGAGLGVHYEGTLATEYMVAFARVGDRMKGKLIQV